MTICTRGTATTSWSALFLPRRMLRLATYTKDRAPHDQEPAPTRNVSETLRTDEEKGSETHALPASVCFCTHGNLRPSPCPSARPSTDRSKVRGDEPPLCAVVRKWQDRQRPPAAGEEAQHIQSHQRTRHERSLFPQQQALAHDLVSETAFLDHPMKLLRLAAAGASWQVETHLNSSLSRAHHLQPICVRLIEGQTSLASSLN